MNLQHQEFICAEIKSYFNLKPLNRWGYIITWDLLFYRSLASLASIELNFLQILCLNLQTCLPKLLFGCENEILKLRLSSFVKKTFRLFSKLMTWKWCCGHLHRLFTKIGQKCHLHNNFQCIHIHAQFSFGRMKIID